MAILRISFVNRCFRDLLFEVKIEESINHRVSTESLNFLKLNILSIIVFLLVFLFVFWGVLMYVAFNLYNIYLSPGKIKMC